MSNVTLVSKDGKDEITLPAKEAAEITNFKAAGWAEKPAAGKPADKATPSVDAEKPRSK